MQVLLPVSGEKQNKTSFSGSFFNKKKKTKHT